MSTVEHTYGIDGSASARSWEAQDKLIYADKYIGEPTNNQGAELLENGCNFRIKTDESVRTLDLVTFNKHDQSIDAEWRLTNMPDEQTKNAHSGFIPKLQAGDTYALRVNQNELILDPFARAITKTQDGSLSPIEYLSAIADHQKFDWESVERPMISPEQRVIYEAHIKSSTMRHPDIPEDLRGTYLGFCHEAHIDHLKKLGVTTVEIQPVQQFYTNQWLLDKDMGNYWGYGTGNFFAPHADYAYGDNPGDSVNEFKTMIKRLHQAGIEVIMDVVYNHTGEDNPLQRLDKSGYYRLDDDGNYIDYTGCGNTIDTSRPEGRELILSSLRLWADEMQIDSFRFDLAPALARNSVGWWQIKDHPLLEAINQDSLLKDRLMIAEPWDIYGYPQPEGQFKDIGWREWNGRFRDLARDVWSTRQRRNLGHAANLLVDSPWAEKSINFITAHDGFTLRDLTTYNSKHNLPNGENNQDGTNDNRSNNHGHEGETDNPTIRKRRLQTAKNLALKALMAQGTPMILAGDEVYHTKSGNNNTYNQDNDLSYIQWERLANDPTKEPAEMFEFISRAIRVRASSNLTGPERTLGPIAQSPIGEIGLQWLNADGKEIQTGDPSWDQPGVLGMYASSGHTSEKPSEKRSLIYYANTSDTDAQIKLPQFDGARGHYALLLNTAINVETAEIRLNPNDSFVLAANASAVLERLSAPLPLNGTDTPLHQELSSIVDLRKVANIDPALTPQSVA
ncbi:hypothetical protein B7Y94_01825 [Candidatus Saccharibacteria bacterium 32-49-12]|nr:MAG: hypothetical protein B7Y94_01825 [Candidatus Saccharibacteria bacterium 32-49-12]